MEDILSGYKTYIVAVLIMAAAVLYHYGFLDQNTFITILGILNGAGLAAYRMGVAKAIDA